MYKILQITGLVICLIFSASSFGQSWEKYTSNTITTIVSDGNGGAIISEYADDPYKTQLFNYDIDGNKEKFVVDTIPYLISKGFRTSDGEFIYTVRSNSSSLFFLKFTSDGDLVFTKPYKGGTIYQLNLPDKEFHQYIDTVFYLLNNDLEVVDTINSTNLWSVYSVRATTQEILLSGTNNRNGVVQMLNEDGIFVDEKILPNYLAQEFTRLPEGSFLGVVDTLALIKFNPQFEVEWEKFVLSSEHIWGRDEYYYKKRPNSFVLNDFLYFGGGNYFLTNNLIEYSFDGDTLRVLEFPGIVDFKNVIFEEDNSIIGFSKKELETPQGIEKVYIVSRIDESSPIVEQNKRITGRLFYDENGNCKYDSGESYFQGALLKTEPFVDFSFTDSSGYFELNLTSDSEYIIKPVTTLPKWQSFQCFSERSVQIIGEGDSSGVDFPIHEELCPQLKLSHSRSTYNRCFPGHHNFYISNIGTEAAHDIQAEIAFPKEIITKSVSELYTFEDGGYNFNLSTLAPGEKVEIAFEDSIDCQANTGFISGLAKVSTSSSCVLVENAGDSLNFGGGIRGSYDPNDKSVFPTRINFSDYSNGLRTADFHINFQNTGDGPAYKVVVVDTISVDLDFEGIADIQASHHYSLQVLQTDPMVLAWSFVGINLPGKEENEPESHGFISFSMPLKENLSNNSVVENRAAIYFDFNDPIVTNTASITISDEVNTDSGIITSIKTASVNLEIHIYPNPVNGSANIILPENVSLPCTFVLINNQGIKVKEKVFSKGENQINTENLPSGLYHYQFNDGKKVIEGNLIVK